MAKFPDKTEQRPAQEIPAQKSLPALLTITRELRNSIYRFPLLSKAPLEVSKEVVRRMCLVQTCEQAQSEASGVFYNEIEFQITLSGVRKEVEAAAG